MDRYLEQIEKYEEILDVLYQVRNDREALPVLIGNYQEYVKILKEKQRETCPTCTGVFVNGIRKRCDRCTVTR